MLRECNCACHKGGLLHIIACCVQCPGCKRHYVDSPEYRLHTRICPLDAKVLEAEYRKSLACFMPSAPTALLLGRFQPFHVGHVDLARQAIERVGQVLLWCKDTPVDEKNPLSFAQRRIFIHAKMQAYLGKYYVDLAPNITDVFYGRDVGYNVEQLDTGVLKQVSATAIRNDVLGLVQ